MALGQEPQPEVLDHVGVLVFVDQDVAEGPVIALQHLRRLLEQGERVQQQVAEVAGVEGPKPVLVDGVELHGPAAGQVPRLARRDLGGPKAPVLPALDRRQHGARRPLLVVDSLGGQDLLHEPQLVVGVDDGEVGAEPGPLGMRPQHPRRQRVEGAEPPALDRAAEQPGDPVLHLLRRLVGEGDGQDLAGGGPPAAQKPGQARGQHPRLAGAGTRQHQDRAVQGLDRLALGGIERRDQGIARAGRCRGFALGGVRRLSHDRDI